MKSFLFNRFETEGEFSFSQEERLHFVTEHFCHWLHGLGGETRPEIDPAVVRNLFSTAYDTKPSLSVPIKIVEMTRVKTCFVDLIDFFLVSDSTGIERRCTGIHSCWIRTNEIIFT